MFWNEWNTRKWRRAFKNSKNKEVGSDKRKKRISELNKQGKSAAVRLEDGTSESSKAAFT